MDTSDAINVTVNVEEGIVPTVPTTPVDPTPPVPNLDGSMSDPLIPGVPNTGFINEIGTQLSQNPYLAVFILIIIVGLAAIAVKYFWHRSEGSLKKINLFRRLGGSKLFQNRATRFSVVPVMVVMCASLLSLPSQAINIGLAIAADEIELNVTQGQSVSTTGAVTATVNNDTDVPYRISAQLTQAPPENIELALATKNLDTSPVVVHSGTGATDGDMEIPLPLIASVIGVVEPGEYDIEINLTVQAIGVAPVVSSVSPNSGDLAGGSAITITGANFYDSTEVQQVFVGANQCSITAVTSTTVSCTTPTSVVSGPQNIRIVTSFGSHTLNNGFSYNAATPPVDGGDDEVVNPLSSMTKIAWSGGNEYWSQFPDAVKAGWAEPTFFPVGTFWDFWPEGNTTEARAAIQHDKDHGINFYTHGNVGQDACALRDVGGMSWLGNSGSLVNLDTCGENIWPGTYLEDEVDGRYGTNENAFGILTTQSNQARASHPNKFVGVNYTSIPIQQWTSSADGGRYVNEFADMVSTDDYLSSTPNKCHERDAPWFPFVGKGPLSFETCRQGQSYGRMTDAIVQRDNLDGVRKPVSAFIDIFAGADPAATSQSSPDDVKAAVVSNLIHEAGFLIYFPLSFLESCETNRLMDANVPACAAAYTQATGEVNNQVKSWAPIINTQSYAHVFGANLDTMLKWYNDSAYIFAMTDGGTGNRTFSLPSAISEVASVTETISGRNIEVSNGQFTDNFVNHSDYRLYKVTP